MSWKFYKELDITEDVQMIHCDTRDFHCSLVTENHKHHTNNKKFLFTTEEVLVLLDRCFTESGGKKKWRYLHFVDEERRECYGMDWQFKYLRFFRCGDHGWICKPCEELKMLEKSFFEGKKAYGDIFESEQYHDTKSVLNPDINHEVSITGSPDGMGEDSFIDYKSIAQGNLLSQLSLSPRQMPFVRKGKKIRRNDPCPCGSGLKSKKCCFT